MDLTSKHTRTVLSDSSNAKRKKAFDSPTAPKDLKRYPNDEKYSSKDNLPIPIFPKKVRKDESNPMPTTERPKASNSISATEIDKRLNHATRTELTKLVKKIHREHPEVGRAIFCNCRPDKEPIEPLLDDPLLKRCFHCFCSDEEQELVDWYSLKTCETCRKFTFNKTETCEWFGFTHSQADNLKRTVVYCGPFRVFQYRYKADTIVRAIKKRHGSMFAWLFHKNRYRSGFSRPPSPTTLQKLDAAMTKPEKNKVLTRDLKHSSDTNLKDMVYTAIWKDRKLTLEGGIIYDFCPAKLRGVVEKDI